MWYRGLVQTLATDQKTANILYIDFGNEENVPVDRIKPLTANIPPFCPCVSAYSRHSNLFCFLYVQCCIERCQNILLFHRY